MTTAYPSYPGGYSIPTFLDFVLQSVVDEYAERSIELPDRRLWVVGDPAYDGECGMVVVNATTLSLGLPGLPEDVAYCNTGRTLDFSVTVLRCTPVAGTRSQMQPDAEALQQSAAEVAADMEILMDLTRRISAVDNALVASVQAVGAEGGLLGAQGSYSMMPYVLV